MKRYLPFIIIALVLAAVIGIFAFTLRKGDSGGDSLTGVSNSPPPNQIAGNPAAPNQSPANSAGLTKPNVKVSSPVVIEEYGDYQCPPCGQLFPELKKTEAEYGTNLRIVFNL